MIGSIREGAIEAHIRALIKQAEDKSRLHRAEIVYEAGWLKSGGVGSSTWTISNPGTSEPSTVDFNISLPDGTFLTSPSKKLLLQALQKNLFHLRMGTTTKKLVSPDRWNNYVQFGFDLCSWLVLHREIYRPDTHGFKLLTVDACEALINKLSMGGWVNALLLKERFVIQLHSSAGSKTSLSDLLDTPNDLPKDFIDEAVEYFHDNNLYVLSAQDSNYKNGLLSRDYLGKVLGRSPTALHQPNFRLFIRQFEPVLANEHLLNRSTRKNKFNTQNTKTLEQASDNRLSVSHLKNLASNLSIFLKGHSRLPDDIPKIEINSKALVKKFLSNLKSPGHTNLIPFTIGLDALNQSANWILTYGKPIVESLIFYIPKFLDIDREYSLSKQSVKKQELFEQTKHMWYTESVGGVAPQRLDEALNIVRLQSKSRKNTVQGQTNYKAVVDSFIGACAISIGMIKPIRDKELSLIPRGCLSIEEPTGGAFMAHESGKSGSLGINPFIERPIPSLTAQAIELLQLLGSSLAKIYGDHRPRADRLFYMPGRGFKMPGEICVEERVNTCLDTFCESIETPIDKLGRRWYIRTHEMRKFFLLFVHRHLGSNSKAILGHNAGHANKKHIDEYIAYEVSEPDAVRYESECIDDKLIALERGTLPAEGNDGLVAIYTEALHHFQASSISAIANNEFLKYLDKINNNPDFDMTTYTVTLENYDNEIQIIDFAIRYGNKKDAKYDK